MNTNLSLALLDLVQSFHLYFFYITPQSEKDEWNRKRFLEHYKAYKEILNGLNREDYEIKDTFLEYGLTEEKIEIMKDCIIKKDVQHLLLPTSASGEEYKHLYILDTMLQYSIANSHLCSSNRKYKILIMKKIIEIVEHWNIYTQFLYEKKFPLGVYPLDVRRMFLTDYEVYDFKPSFNYPE